MAPKSTTFAWPIAGTAAALLLSPALDIATGSEAASVLVLLGLIVALWSLPRLSSAEVGLRLGGARDYAIALLYPVMVMAACAAVAQAGDIAENAPRTADKWIGELDRQIQTLEQFPTRCAVIPEATELGREYRHLIHGRHRTIFRVDGRVVWIVRVIHGAQLLATEVLET